MIKEDLRNNRFADLTFDIFNEMIVQQVCGYQEQTEIKTTSVTG